MMALYSFCSLDNPQPFHHDLYHVLLPTNLNHFSSEEAGGQEQQAPVTQWLILRMN